MAASLNCECLVCKTKFHLKQSAIDKGKGKYCSKACSNSDRGGVTMIDFKCDCCGSAFSRKSNGKNESKFCSKKCFAVFRTTKIEHACGFCGKTHYVTKSKFEVRENLFCSVECGLNARDVMIERRRCENCANEFDFYPNKKSLDWGKFCSRKCKGIVLRGIRNKTSKGGCTISENGMRKISVDTLPRPTPMLEHRFFAEKYIGRKLHRSEVIIHLNGNNSDNNLSNLFICGDGAGEMIKRHNGVLPWPKESNLETYK